MKSEKQIRNDERFLVINQIILIMKASQHDTVVTNISAWLSSEMKRIVKETEVEAFL